MPGRILFPQFRDQFEPTRYPFGDNASLVSRNTGQVLDNDTFLDASVYPIGSEDKVCIDRVLVTSRLVTIQIGDPSTPNLATASFDPVVPPSLLRLTDSFGRPAGVLVSEPLRLARFGAWRLTEHLFGPDEAEFAASCVIPKPGPGVRGVLTVDGDLAAGDVWLVGDNGIVLRDEGDGNIRVDIVGDPLFVRALCQPLGRFQPPRPILTINNCPPDEFGNFNLTVGNHLAEDTVLRIRATDQGDALIIEAIGQLVRATN